MSLKPPRRHASPPPAADEDMTQLARKLWDRASQRQSQQAGASMAQDAGAEHDAPPPPSTGDSAAATVVSRGVDDVVTEEQVARLRARANAMRRYHELKDGDLVVASSPPVTHVGLVETVADVLIDDLLHQHAKDLSAVCKELCEEIFRMEFGQV